MIQAYGETMKELGARRGVSALTLAPDKRLEGRASTLEELDRIQDTLAPHLATDHPEDGCYARAQLYSRELRERGISHGKLFVYSTYKQLGLGDTRWNYHVATLALTESEPLVMDPLISPDPIPADTWLETFQRGHVIAVLHSDRKYLNGIGGGSDFDQNTSRAWKTLGQLSDA